MSDATREILGNQPKSQDIFLRPGIIGKTIDSSFNINDNYKIKFLHSNHCLGSCQIKVTANDFNIIYSGDFFNPKTVENAEHLIIDEILLRNI